MQASKQAKEIISHRAHKDITHIRMHIHTLGVRAFRFGCGGFGVGLANLPVAYHTYHVIPCWALIPFSLS